ncbi:hypothetical protein H6G27_26465 [Nostoc linckia FACHB-104]|nr:hypothetical protein [Nostoc linckia FACHB-104]
MDKPTVISNSYLSEDERRRMVEDRIRRNSLQTQQATWEERNARHNNTVPKLPMLRSVEHMQVIFGTLDNIGE